MLIVCPSCLSAYRMPSRARDAAAMRCAQCSKVFEAVPLPSLQPHGSGSQEVMAALPGTRADPLPRSSRVRPLPDPDETTRFRIAPTAVAAVVLLAAGMGGIAWRTPLAAAVPATAPLFAAIGLPVTGSLSIGPVVTALADDGPTRVLTLSGTIRNTNKHGADVPNIRIVVRDEAEQSVYSWVAPGPQPRLGPGEAVEFHSRLVSPPVNGHDLVVSFADRADGATAAEVRATP